MAVPRSGGGYETGVRFSPLTHSECAGHWFNAVDPEDEVLHYPLDENIPQ